MQINSVYCAKKIGESVLVALKMTPLNSRNANNILLSLKKETAIHSALSKASNGNILKFISNFLHEGEVSWAIIVLEYAEGGELFSRIEPDLGLPISVTKAWFVQLISAIVNYLLVYLFHDCTNSRIVFYS